LAASGYATFSATGSTCPLMINATSVRSGPSKTKTVSYGNLSSPQGKLSNSCSHASLHELHIYHRRLLPLPSIIPRIDLSEVIVRTASRVINFWRLLPSGHSLLAIMDTLNRSFSPPPTSPIFSQSKQRSGSWPISIPNPIPYKYRVNKLRSKLRARQSPTSSIADIETTFSPIPTLQALRTHRWTVYDLQYALFFSLGLFAMCISPSPSPLLKAGAVLLLSAALLMPVTSQFFLPFLPILTWLIFFFSCR
jgi:hypothetical protein